MKCKLTKIVLVLMYTTFWTFCSGIQSEGVNSRSRQRRETCFDRKSNCKDFAARNYCHSGPYVTWMRTNCRRSCNMCTVSSNGGSTCVDRNRFCKDWASKGECQKNPNYMLVNCKRSCGTCSTGNCVDKNNRCQTFKYNGYCNSAAYKNWMKNNCPRTCGFCPVNGKWGSWSPYQSCSVTCGSGVQTRTRLCNNPSPKNGGKQCAGSKTETRRCQKGSCKGDGGWSPWGNWFACSKSCGKDGKQIRLRTCDNPRPEVGGKSCPGAKTQERACNIKPCPTKPIDGNWSLWSVWSFCSPECLRSRTRFCNNPKPQNGGKLCQGESLEMLECRGGSCTGTDDKKCGTRIQRGRIVGGVRVYPGEFPWQVGIRRIFQSKVFCGGSLIDNGWIVTASHCVDGEDAEILEVILGDVDQSTQDGQEISANVKRYFKHPNYNSINYDNDIALIQLDKKITYSKYIKPVCLPNNTITREPDVGTNCFVTGFGRIQEGGSLSPSLRQAELPVVNRTVCSKAYEDYQALTDNMFCVGREEGGVDSCQGDSGGPLVCELEKERFYLAGVVSWGVGCARQKRYGVYANVAVLKKWVDQKIKQVEQEP